MQITINGEQQTLAAEKISLKELLHLSGVESVEMVSVQRNGEFVDKDDFASVQIAPSDEIDFLYFMGGGAQ